MDVRSILGKAKKGLIKVHGLTKEAIKKQKEKASQKDVEKIENLLKEFGEVQEEYHAVNEYIRNKIKRKNLSYEEVKELDTKRKHRDKVEKELLEIGKDIIYYFEKKNYEPDKIIGEVYYQIALICYRLDNYEYAKMYAERSLELLSDASYMHRILGWYYEKHDKFALAKKHNELAKELEKEQSEDTETDGVTPEEEMLFDELTSMGIDCKLHYWDGYKTVDINLPYYKVDIEIDGSQHNTSYAQAISDLRRTLYSSKDGRYTLRVPNILIRQNVEEVAKIIIGIAKKHKGKSHHSRRRHHHRY